MISSKHVAHDHPISNVHDITLKNAITFQLLGVNFYHTNYTAVQQVPSA
jgi:hypothetical protein